MSTYLPAIFLAELSTRDYRRMKEINNLKDRFKKPFRCAPCIRMDNIAFTLENVEYYVENIQNKASKLDPP